MTKNIVSEVKIHNRSSDPDKFVPVKREVRQVHEDCYIIEDEKGILTQMRREDSGRPWEVRMVRRNYDVQELRSIIRHVGKIAKLG